MGIWYDSCYNNHEWGGSLWKDQKPRKNMMMH
jgi:hypothetical protein